MLFVMGDFVVWLVVVESLSFFRKIVMSYYFPWVRRIERSQCFVHLVVLAWINSFYCWQLHRRVNGDVVWHG